MKMLLANTGGVGNFRKPSYYGNLSPKPQTINLKPYIPLSSLDYSSYKILIGNPIIYRKQSGGLRRDALLFLPLTLQVDSQDALQNKKPSVAGYIFIPLYIHIMIIITLYLHIMTIIPLHILIV